MLARGWTRDSWLAAGHSIDPYVEPSLGGLWTANPYKSAVPPVIVQASGGPDGPQAPRESLIPPAPGPVPAGTPAADVLQRWLSPLAAGKAPAQTPLLVVGVSAWSAVAATVEASAGRSYPTTYLRLPVQELPFDETTAMLLRSNAYTSRVISLALPSMAAAAALAPSLGRLRAALPQHSLVF